EEKCSQKLEVLYNVRPTRSTAISNTKYIGNTARSNRPLFKISPTAGFSSKRLYITSITEGAGAVAHSLIELNKDFTDHTDKLASILVKIKNQLEDNNLPGIPSSLTDS